MREKLQKWWQDRYKYKLETKEASGKHYNTVHSEMKSDGQALA